MLSDGFVLSSFQSQPDQLHKQGHFYFVNFIFLPSIMVASCCHLWGHPSRALCFTHAFLRRKKDSFLFFVSSSDLAICSSAAPFPFSCFRFANKMLLVAEEGCSPFQSVLSTAYRLMQIGTFTAQADSSCVIQWHFLLKSFAWKRSLKGTWNEVTVWGEIQFQPQRQYSTKQ